MPARQPQRNVRYVVSHGYTKPHDTAGAVAMVRLLATDDATMWSRATRSLVATRIAEFLLEQQTRMDNIEFGAKQLLLQAAEQLGSEREAA